MKIKNIAILGLGLIGGSIAKALKNSKTDFIISAYDHEDVIESALKVNTINTKLKNVEDALSADVIFLCLPVELSVEVFQKLAPKLNEGCILTDVCGVKSVFHKIWESIQSKGIYVGGHPMTGKEKGGYENSDPLLFENSIYIVSKNLSADPDLNDFKRVLELLGANILVVPPQQHDIIVASVSHLPQLVSIALVNAASLKTDNYNFLDLAAGGFKDMTRIAASDFKMWESVIIQNKREILIALDKFSLELNKVKSLIQKDKFNDLGDKFEEARKSRDEIPQNIKGFLKPLHDIYVFVKDEPGVISKISTALYEQNINIKDMELLKIREGTGGTFRLSFELSSEAERAEKLISSLGFLTK